LPFRLNLPAPQDSQSGDSVYLFREVTVSRADLPDLTTWMIVDVMAVGDDGVMRTTSPPNVGVSGRVLDGNNSLFQYSDSGMLFAASPSLFTGLGAISDLGTRLSTQGDAQFGNAVISMDSAIEDAADGSTKYYAANDAFGTFLVPAVYSIDYVLTQYSTDPSGLIETSNQQVLIQSGTVPAIILPSIPRTQQRNNPPSLSDARLVLPSSAGDALKIELSGQDFTLENPFANAPLFDGTTLGSKVEDLFVTIEIGQRDTFDTDGTPLILGGKDIVIEGSELTLSDDKLSFEIPDGSQLAGAAITVTRPMDLPVDNRFARQELTSNPIQILADQRYGAVASGADGRVLIYDVCGTLSEQGLGLECGVPDAEADEKLNPFVRAQITLADGTEDKRVSPRKTVSTNDGTRFYVTADQGIVAAIDTVSLQQIDVLPDDPEKPETLGVNAIQLPAGAKPFDAIADENTRRLYVSDYQRASVYVVDIDTYSPTYHTTIQTINFPSVVGTVFGIGSIGLRGLAIDSAGDRLFVAAPAQDLFGVRGGRDGVILSVSLRDDNREFLATPEFDAQDEQSLTVVGPGPYEITATDDSGVMLIADRVADAYGLTVIREQDEGPWQATPVGFQDYGAIPRLVEGRGTQVHGVSNAQGVAYIEANAFIDSIGEHPAYAVVSGFRQFVQGDPKHDPNIGPFFAYNAYQFDASGRTQIELIAAGGTIGLIRDPLSDSDDPEKEPRLVAATTPIVNGFTDDIALSVQSGLVLAPQQGQDIVTGYNLAEMIRLVEEEANGLPVPPWSQIGEDPAANGPLSRLLRGPLSTLPIDRVDPTLAQAADFRFHTLNVSGSTVLAYGVPPIGPTGDAPNAYAPLPGGNLPRGVSIQPAARGDLLALAPTPYNQTPSLLGFPARPFEVEAGIHAMVEVHSGAVQESVPLVTYRSREQERGLVLHYDSLRADPRPIHYLNLTQLDKIDYDASSDRLAYRVTAIAADGTRFQSDGITAEKSEEIGVPEGFSLFKLPTSPEEGESFGVGLQLDLRDADTGLYTFEVEYGLMRKQGEQYVGRIVSQTTVESVVNDSNSPFGGGWNLEGYLRMYPGDAGVLLVDGNGLEHIYLAPEEGTDLFTATVEDYSELKFEDNKFRRRLRDGTVQVFDQEGFLETSTDRNGNKTTFVHEDGRLTKVVDPVELETVLTYSGDVIQTITDPASRVTTLSVVDGNLESVTHPDTSKLSFEYEYEHEDDDEIGKHLLTGQRLRRGNDPTDPLAGEFNEEYQYDDVHGRFVSGTRIDGKTTTLTAAQVTFLADPEKAVEPDESEELHLLSSPSDPDTTQQDVPECGIEHESNTGTQFTAQATHTDFRGTRREFEMTGFGQYHDSRQDDRETKVATRGLNGGRISAEIDAVGNVVCYVRDLFGNVVQQTDFPDGPAVQLIAYDYDPDFDYEQSFNIPVRITDAVNRETLHTLDNRGNILTTVISDPSAPDGSPVSTTQNYTYDASHGFLVDVATDGEGNTIDRNYNALGLMSAMILEDGQRSYTYYPSGYVHTMVDANGFTTEYIRDPMNRITEEINFGPQGTEPIRRTYEYDAHGNETRLVDRDGNITEKTWDVMDRAKTSIADVGGLELKTEHAYELGTLAPSYTVTAEPGGDVHVLKQPDGEFITTVYNQYNEVTASYDQLGRKTTYRLDDAGRTTDIILHHGGVISRELDARGRVTAETGPLPDMRTDTTYDLVDRTTRVEIANTTGPQVTEYTYNLFNEVATKIDAVGDMTRYEYDNAGNRTAVIIAAGTADAFRSEMTYDDRNRVETETVGAAEPRRFTYFPEGQLETTTNTRGFVTRQVIDQLGRVIETHDAEGGVTLTTYSGEGNVLSVDDARSESHVFTYEYDGAHRLIREIDPEGRTTTHDYDAMGRRTQTTDPRNPLGTSSSFTTTTEHDALGRVVEVIDAEGNKTEYTYDEWDSIETITRPAPGQEQGGLATFVVTNSWSPGRRVQTTTIPLDAVGTANEVKLEQTFDTLGNLIKERKLDSNVVTTWKYDELNRMVERTEGAESSVAATTKREYDGRGNIVRRVDARGTITEYEFDNRQFLSESVTAKDTVDEIRIVSVYDDEGNLVSRSDPRPEVPATEYSYDRLNRRTQTIEPSGDGLASIVFEYDGIGNITKEFDPRNPLWFTTYEFDSAGRLDKKIDALGYEWLYGYDDANNQTSITNPKGETQVFYYDGLNRQTGSSDANGHTTCSVYDAAGNVITEIMPNAGLTTCTVATVGGAQSLTHTKLMTFDNASRMTSMTDAEGNTTRYEYDSAGRMTAMIDPRSTLSNENVTRYEYDPRGNVTKLTMPSGLSGNDEELVTEHQYDLNNNRTVTTDARGVETRTDYDVLNRAVAIHRETAVPQNGDSPGYAGSGVETTGYVYDKAGNVLTVLDPRGAFFNTVSTYDDASNLSTQTTNTGTPENPGPIATWVSTYDKLNNLLTSQDPRGEYFTTIYAYDELGRQDRVERPRGLPSQPLDPAVESYEFDSAGRLTAAVGPRIGSTGELLRTSYEYDPAGRQVKVTDPANNESFFDYDFNGNVIRERHLGDGFAATRVIEHTFDQKDRLLSTTDAESYVTRLEYDAVDNIVATIGPLNDSTGQIARSTTVYDAANRVRSETDFENNESKFAYDNAGNVIAATDGRGDLPRAIVERSDGRN
ncbi:MAG: hypothetical protein AAFX06_28655, partial [Planctomycetota bacterium]